MLEAIKIWVQRSSILSLKSEDTVASISSLKHMMCRVATDAEKQFNERGHMNLHPVTLILHAHIMDSFMSTAVIFKQTVFNTEIF